MITPNGIKTACGLGLLGGVFSVACLALYFKPEDGSLAVIAFYMLVAVLFFATAGAFTKNGQWKWRVALFVNILTIGIIFACMIGEFFAMDAGAVLLVIAIFIFVLELLPSSKAWMQSEI
ncbi:MAG: hypothetical protein WCQ23_01480 [Candidatus Methanomethylophilaceae archaeon]|jgi:hypothetical protein